MRGLHRAMGTSVRWAVDFEAWHPTRDQLTKAVSCLQPEEKVRVGKFVFRRDQKASLLGHLLIRKFVSSCGGVPYKELLIQRDERGKPFCKQAPNLSFNVSHHGRFSVLAGEVGGKIVGVDIMTAEYGGGKQLSEFFRLMSRQFSPYEWGTIRSGATEREQMTLFNRHWALKESYVKATGTGIVVDLQNLEFRVKTKELLTGSYVTDTQLYVGGMAQQWRFEEVLLGDHVVAVAVSPPGDATVPSPPFQILTVEDLLEGSEPLLPPDEKYCEEFFEKDECPY